MIIVYYIYNGRHNKKGVLVETQSVVKKYLIQFTVTGFF